MKVIFLAGGISRRMWPLSQDKNLVEFLGKPAIFYALETVKKAGVKEVVLVGNEDNIKSLEKIAKSLGLKTQIVVQAKNLPGQGGAILSAKKYILGPVLICNANDFFDVTLYQDIFKRAKNPEFDAQLVGYKVKNYFPGGYLKVEKGQVLEIVEKPPPGKAPSNLVRIVVDFFTRGEDLVKILESLETDPDIWYEEAIDKTIKTGKKVVYLEYSGTWKFLKYPWHILDLTEYFLDKVAKRKISKSAKIAKTAVVDGEVIISDNVRVLERSVIRGPAYIGKGAIIGNNALVRQSIVGEDTVVGFSSEVTRSYVGKSCWFHTNYIGDSVISDNVSFGSGAITANLRLDEEEIYSKISGSKINTQRNKLGAIIGQGSRIGVNAMIMPGIKIGKNSFVGPGVVLGKDLEDGSFCQLLQEYQITKNRVDITVKTREKFRKKL